MENQKIKDLQNELKSLTNQFNENMKRISSLLKFTKQQEQFADAFPQMENIDKAISERLRLIKENFQINWARVDILRKLKDSQSEACSLSDSEIPSRENSLCNGEFFENWKKEYQEKGDFLMVEIIDILNN